MKVENIEARASAALEYLTDTDELAADLKAEVERTLQLYKSTTNAHFLARTGTAEERKRAAEREAEPLYDDYLKAVREYEAVANKRKSETIAIEWLRSLYSNYRQGR